MAEASGRPSVDLSGRVVMSSEAAAGQKQASPATKQQKLKDAKEKAVQQLGRGAAGFDHRPCDSMTQRSTLPPCPV
jgi:hypothetical protein